MKIVLINPYYEEVIEVLEDLDYFNKAYENILNGREESIRLTQTKRTSVSKSVDCYVKVIFINPRHWAKVEVE